MKKIVLLLLLSLLANVGFSQIARTTLTLTASNYVYTSFTNQEIVMNGTTDLHITATSKQLNNSIIQLNSENAWVFIDNVRPYVVIDSLLKYVYVNNSAAVIGTNVRVSIYRHGTVIIPHSSAFKPVTVYTGQNFTGDSASYSMNVFNNALGAFDNQIRSFKLKRGHMATLATASDGTGYSRVYVADDKDLAVAVLPNLLDQKISFVRTMSWEWPSKKGWCGWNLANYKLINATWNYDWGSGGATSAYTEYVPMRWGSGGALTDVSSKTNVTHVLGFNEPDHTDQSNLTLDQMITMWPEFLKTGLRVGSPAWANPWGGFGGTLFDFINKCDQLNYRVDYIDLHCYWGGKSPQSWYNDLKYIHDLTGRPLWITEWNNGANWTTEWWPDASKALTTANAAKQLSDLKGILQVLDTASFVERYAIYDWVQDCRAVILGDTLTPAGKYYASTTPTFAYNKKYEKIPTFVYNNPSLSIAFSTKKLVLTLNDPNFENFIGYVIERKIDDGNFTEFANTSSTTLKTLSDTLDASIGTRFRYRARSKFANGSYSAYTNEVGWDITNGTDIQFGTLSANNVGWNNVFFRNPYATIPTIVLGAATNANTGVLLTPRAKLISSTSRFNIQLAPWSYQNVTTLANEETVPYLVMNQGVYNLGGLKAVAGKATISSTWYPVTFSSPFDTIPVVFANQLLSSSTNATVVRIKNVTKTGFMAKIMKESGVTTSILSETVTYFAIAPGTGQLYDRKIKVGKTSNTAVSPTTYSLVNYGDSIANPIFMTQLQTCNDDTVTANIRCLYATSKFASVTKQREKSAGVTVAATEGAGWLIIGPANSISAVNNPQASRFSIYPNPVNDVLYINREDLQPTDIDIYNYCGVKVKSIRLTDNQIRVGDLPPGCYLLKSKDSVQKFMKY